MLWPVRAGITEPGGLLTSGAQALPQQARPDRREEDR